MTLRQQKDARQSKTIGLVNSVRKEWLNEPVVYVYHLWPHVSLWDKQVEILCSLRDNNKTAVKSCNSGGKTFTAALATHWWMDTHYPAKVITTAPGWEQVEGVLWRDIGNLYNKSSYPKGGEMLQTVWKVNDEHFAKGISTNDVNRMQGWHSPNLLALIDEAQGADPLIWEAISSLQPKAILVIGNPLEPSGDFFNCFNSPLWKNITISALDAIRWQDEHGSIPGLVTRKWVEEVEIEHGCKSAYYMARVLGEFPTEGPGTLISRAWVDRARKKDNSAEDFEEDTARVIPVDVATKHGNNLTVIGYRYGHTMVSLKSHRQIPVNRTADLVSEGMFSRRGTTAVVDSDGIGEGLADFLIAKNIPTIEFHGGYGQEAMDSTRFRNLRSQFWWIVSKKFEKGMYDLRKLPDDEFEILKNQLCCIKVKPNDAYGRIQVETKDDLHARGIMSPDHADAFIMGEYGYWMGGMVDIKPYKVFN